MTLKQLRESKGLTQQQVASKMRVDVSLIDNYENGTATPRGSSMMALAEALDVQTDSLIDYFKQVAKSKAKADTTSDGEAK